MERAPRPRFSGSGGAGLGKIRHCGDGRVWFGDDAVMSLFTAEPGLLNRCPDGVITWEGDTLVLVACGETYPLEPQPVRERAADSEHTPHL